MFVTTVEGAVEAAREANLRSAWEDMSAGLPAGFIESFLLHSEDETWRIVTVWESKEAVTALRASGPADRQDDVRASRVDGDALHVDGRGPDQRDLTQRP
jgi:heme-degrading monooxygenase HmoA